MPTVLRKEGFLRFYFYSHEPNEPAYVHVDRGVATDKLWLDLVALARKGGGFRPSDLTRILTLVLEQRSELLESWHGHFSPRG